jgi:SAM-dependent methyltransferase
LNKAGVSREGVVLDVGCGQGQFSEYIAETGRRVLGVDLSEVGIKYAATQRRSNLEIGYLLANPFDDCFAEPSFSAIFCRSFSPYNTDEFGANSEITRQLLRLIRPGGCLVWCYASRLFPEAGQKWRWHTVRETQQHFSSFDANVYFTLRLECRILGRYSFSRPMTWLAEKACRCFRFGGELVAIVRKSERTT